MSDVPASSGSAPAASSTPSTGSSTPTASTSSAPSTSSGAPAASDKGPISGAHDKPAGDVAADAAAPAPGAQPTKEQVAAAKRKLKVEGKEVLVSDQELEKFAQLGMTADSRFKEAAEMRKTMTEIVQALQNDPISALQALGIEFDPIAEKHLTERIKREMMDPVERELEDLRNYKKQQEEERQRLEQDTKKKTHTQQFEQLKQQASATYTQKIGEVLTKTNLPRTPETIQWMSQELANAVEHGYDMDFEIAASRVRQRYQTAIKSLVGDLDGEQLLEILGGDPLVNKIRKYDLTRLQAQLAQRDPAANVAQEARRVVSEPTERRQQQTSFLDKDSWVERLNKKMGQ